MGGVARGFHTNITYVNVGSGRTKGLKERESWVQRGKVDAVGGAQRGALMPLKSV